MKRKRIVAGAVATLVLVGAAYLALLSFGVLAPASAYRPVPAGHREIVFLAPATSGESWERLVAAVDAMAAESQQAGSGKAQLHVWKERAFTALTADVPEVALWPEGCENAKLWIRWCKLSAESKSEDWIARLTKQETPPLAVIGGDNSFRALRVAKALDGHRGDWQGPPPLLFITTATAVSTPDPKWPTLIDVYKGRSFRFSFTNTRMAAAVLDFVRGQPELWPSAPLPRELAETSVRALATARDPLAAAGLATIVDELFTTYLYTIKWEDDSFSVDLADGFSSLFLKMFPRPRSSSYPIEYSVGDFYQPNPKEAFVVGQILPDLKAAREHRQLLVLPADAERARRFLRTVVRRAEPRDLKHLVVLAADSVNFNAIYRDRNVLWNIQDMPVPLVLFSHRNPVAKEVGFTGQGTSGATGTEDLLLYRDMVVTLLITAYQGQQLTVAGDELAARLHGLCWANGRVHAAPAGGKGMLLFNRHDGNRNDGTGEHIIVLKPDLEERNSLAQATITVWHLEAEAGQSAEWREVRTLAVTYDGLAPLP